MTRGKLRAKGLLRLASKTMMLVLVTRAMVRYTRSGRTISQSSASAISALASIGTR
jgi:hypothetical protein